MTSRRFAATMGCIVAGLDTIGNDQGQLGLPHWLWIAAGIGWFFIAYAVATRGTD